MIPEILPKWVISLSIKQKFIHPCGEMLFKLAPLHREVRGQGQLWSSAVGAGRNVEITEGHFADTEFELRSFSFKDVSRLQGHTADQNNKHSTKKTNHCLN